ncbi:uncharacterized protein LOC129956767 [Argiope bruennichi]|uniref:uncharacterized protein LOC129956767 n=1 Tax=Argiope bruennichi TaxID=94029 RepID=UPI002495437D|nr:uncharacterized protein LOC129956767 [Argiope bruennichi]
MASTINCIPKLSYPSSTDTTERKGSDRRPTPNSSRNPRRNFPTPCLNPEPGNKYDKLNWNAHLRYQATRAAILHQNLLKIAGKSWRIKQAQRKTLYSTVIERVLAHGAAIWCQDPTERMKRKLAAIQRPFLLAISGAYRTTSTAALQIILGIPPLHLQLQREAKGISLCRLKNPTNNCHLQISQLEIDCKISGWTSHPSVHLEDHQISLDDGGLRSDPNGIYTDGSKTDKGVGAAYCVFNNGVTTTTWATKLAHHNTVFQAEILALYKAAEFLKSTSATSTIYVDNRTSILAAKNPKSNNKCARKIFAILSTNANIKISWIKAHAGYAGNEKADRLAKQAADSNSPIQPEPYPISFIKSSLRQTMLEKWQTEWDNGETGRLIYQLLPKATYALEKGRNSLLHRPWPISHLLKKVQFSRRTLLHLRRSGVTTPLRNRMHFNYILSPNETIS